MTQPTSAAEAERWHYVPDGLGTACGADVNVVNNTNDPDIVTCPGCLAAKVHRFVGDRAKTVRSLLTLAELRGVAFPAGIRLYSTGLLSLDMDDTTHAEVWCRAFMVESHSHVYDPDEDGVIIRIVSGHTTWRGWSVQWQASEEVGRVTPEQVAAAVLTPDAPGLPDDGGQ